MGSRSDDGNPVSGLPEDWGRIVIPEDASELDELAQAVRFELGRSETGHERRQRRLPYIVVAVTLAIALVSLFTVPWLGGAGQITPPRPSTSTSTTGPTETDADTGCGPDQSCATASTGVGGSG